VSSAPNITHQPGNTNVNFGGTASFTVAASGSQPLSYFWYDQSNNLVGTSTTLIITNAAQNNSYHATVTNQFGSATSDSASLDVFGAPIRISNPSGYNHLKLAFAGYTNGMTLTNFPVLIRLSATVPGFSYAQFVSPSTGADLRFTDTNGFEIPFEIDQWNPAGESLVWVQVPYLSSTNDYITAYWGNAADGGMLPCNTNGAVWVMPGAPNNFMMVYHLSQSGFPFTDSTLQYPVASGGAPVSNTGIVGKGCGFNGSSEFLDAGQINVGKAFTVSAWVNINPNVMNEQTIWCNKAGGWNTAGFDFYVNSYQTNDGIVYFDSADGIGGNVSARTAYHTVSFGQWHLLTGTMDGVSGSVHVYVDGTDKTTNTGVDTALQTTNYVRFGALLTGTPGTSGGLPFNGSMDEARFETGIRPAAWVAASWATVANNSFTQYGSVVPKAFNLQYQTIHGRLVLTWPSGTLQIAESPAGSFTDLPSATSPYTNTAAGSPQFFRVRIQ
jgi:hypothetical protein